MIKIAICDDEPRELAATVAYTKEYLEAKNIAATVCEFRHPDELLIACENERFSIYILDIVMPMVNGIAVGKTIRRLDRAAAIIYVTGEAGFALNAYAANPINYLLKPIEKKQLFDTLSLTILRLDLLNESTISVKTKDGIRILHLSDISCCEYQKHAAIYTLPYDGRITTRTLPGSFVAHIEPLLQDERFLRPHISYVVNMGYVECFAKESFTLCGGIVVPIAAKQYSEVRQAYMEYLVEKKKGQRKP